jgi:AcrR family transcriptional regulator
MAEHGIYAVSNRHISKGAGQGNATAVGYHFGTKKDLVEAILERHMVDVEARRRTMIAAMVGRTRLRDWVGCVVRPMTEHLESLNSPSWFARFSAQVVTDPVLGAILVNQATTSRPLREAIEGLAGCLPNLTPAMRAERSQMMRHLLTHIPAEQERLVAEGRPIARPSWTVVADGLIAGVTALWLAPVS